MKIDTTLKEFENELNEVINLFDEKDLTVTLDFSENEKEFIYDIKMMDNKQVYKYEKENYESELVVIRYKKRYAKLSLYLFLSAYFKKDLPWGSLTGIRPTKMARQEIESCKDFVPLFEKLKVSKDKIELSKKIIQVQKNNKVDCDNDFNLYIGIPFCPSRCNYCSFISAEVARCKDKLDLYVDTLVKEIVECKKFIKNLKSVYVGGGTPLTLNESQLEKIFVALGKIDCEFTVEAGRADVITKEKLQLLKDYGVNRVCVNPQTMNDKTLQVIGRKHSVQDFIDSYNLAKEFGFIINCDLIAGLKGETHEDFKYSLDSVISLDPDNITVHTLALKKGAVLKEEKAKSDEKEVEKMIDYTHKTLSSNGYLPYYLYRQKYMAGSLENTGYTKENKECKYNIEVMEELSQNLALGANAISKRVYGNENRIERYKNPKDLVTYINKIDEIISKKRELYE